MNCEYPGLLIFFKKKPCHTWPYFDSNLISKSKFYVYQVKRQCHIVTLVFILYWLISSVLKNLSNAFNKPEYKDVNKVSTETEKCKHHYSWVLIHLFKSIQDNIKEESFSHLINIPSDKWKLFNYTLYCSNTSICYYI